MDVSEKYLAFNGNKKAKLIYNRRTLFEITNRIRPKINIYFHAVDGVAKGRSRKIKTSYFKNSLKLRQFNLCFSL